MLQRCEALMLQSKVQFVLGHAHPQAKGALDEGTYVSARIGQDRLIPVSSPGKQGMPRHPLVGRPADDVPVLQYTVESGLGRIVRAVVGRRLDTLPVSVAFTAHLASVLRTMVLDGRGIAWLPETLVEEDITAGRLVAAAASDWWIPLEIRLYRDRRPAASAAETFWSAVTSVAPTGMTAARKSAGSTIVRLSSTPQCRCGPVARPVAPTAPSCPRRAAHPPASRWFRSGGSTA